MQLINIYGFLKSPPYIIAPAGLETHSFPPQLLDFSSYKAEGSLQTCPNHHCVLLGNGITGKTLKERECRDEFFMTKDTVSISNKNLC